MGGVTASPDTQGSADTQSDPQRLRQPSPCKRTNPGPVLSIGCPAGLQQMCITRKKALSDCICHLLSLQVGRTPLAPQQADGVKDALRSTRCRGTRHRSMGQTQPRRPPAAPQQPLRRVFHCGQEARS